MTPNQDRRALDSADTRRANALEAEAETLLIHLPGGEATLRAYLEERGAHAERTRGPRVEALRVIARAHREYASVQALLTEADVLYWQVIARHDGWLRIQARRATRAHRPGDAALSDVRMGAYRAALRFDPDRGFAFPSFAKHWVRVALQRASDEIPSGIHVGSAAAARGHRPRVDSLDAPVGDDTATLKIDLLVAPDDDEEAAEIADVQAALERVDTLPEPAREMLVRHYGLGGRMPEALGRIGVDFALSRERIRQIVAQAVRRLRADVAPAVAPEPSTPDRSPTPMPTEHESLPPKLEDVSEPLRTVLVRHFGTESGCPESIDALAREFELDVSATRTRCRWAKATYGLRYVFRLRPPTLGFCQIVTCVGRVFARGLCQLHYSQARDANRLAEIGLPTKASKSKPDLPEAKPDPLTGTEPAHPDLDATEGHPARCPCPACRAAYDPPCKKATEEAPAPFSCCGADEPHAHVQGVFSAGPVFGVKLTTSPGRVGVGSEPVNPADDPPVLLTEAPAAVPFEAQVEYLMLALGIPGDATEILHALAVLHKRDHTLRPRLVAVLRAERMRGEAERMVFQAERMRLEAHRLAAEARRLTEAPQ